MQHSSDFIALCDDAKSRIQECTADQAEMLLNQSTPPVLIDVRDQNEFDQGHLPNATFLSKGWIEAKIHHIVSSKDTPILLYCGGGNRSAIAADNLQRMGYSHILSMIGGYKGWVKAGKRITTPDQNS